MSTIIPFCSGGGSFGGPGALLPTLPHRNTPVRISLTRACRVIQSVVPTSKDSKGLRDSSTTVRSQALVQQVGFSREGMLG